MFKSTKLVIIAGTILFFWTGFVLQLFRFASRVGEVGLSQQRPALYLSSFHSMS